MLFPEKIEFYLHEQNYPDIDHLLYYIYTKKEKKENNKINLLLRLHQQFCCHVSIVPFHNII